jgi:hypothetical protein
MKGITMSNTGIKKKSQRRRWALLIYIAGDNNLSDAGLEDIQEMCNEGASQDIHVGVELDTYGEHTGSIRYEITEPDWSGQAFRTVIQRLPEKDTGDPETLKRFLRWGIRRYPADHRLLVVWNHGAGFRSIRRDIAYDDFGSSLDMPEIETALKRAGITPKNKIQIIGFDACLMNMLEIVHHFHDQVEIVVGSQQTEPGDGWPYDKVLKQAKIAETPVELARGIVQEYLGSYRHSGIENVTQSAIKTVATPSIITAVDHLGKLLVANIKDIRDTICKIRINAQTFQMADYVDLIHLARLITQNITDTQIKSTANMVISATESSIIANASYGAAVKNAHGLSIWFPAASALYLNYRAKYMELKCNSSSFGWREFLDTYHR